MVASTVSSKLLGAMARAEGFRFEETLHRFHNMVADSLVGNDAHVPAGDAELEHFWGKAA